MPIRVRVERVGYYPRFPDKIIHDVTIERTDETKLFNNKTYRKYTFDGGKCHVWHGTGEGVEFLVQNVLEQLVDK